MEQGEHSDFHASIEGINSGANVEPPMKLLRFKRLADPFWNTKPMLSFLFTGCIAATLMASPDCGASLALRQEIAAAIGSEGVLTFGDDGLVRNSRPLDALRAKQQDLAARGVTLDYSWRVDLEETLIEAELRYDAPGGEGGVRQVSAPMAFRLPNPGAPKRQTPASVEQAMLFSRPGR
ncbi:hypothetical protein GC169_01265 [bacterium]|nr:hypothetical protein [bacterium]